MYQPATAWRKSKRNGMAASWRSINGIRKYQHGAKEERKAKASGISGRNISISVKAISYSVSSKAWHRGSISNGEKRHQHGSMAKSISARQAS